MRHDLIRLNNTKELSSRNASWKEKRGRRQILVKVKVMSGFPTCSPVSTTATRVDMKTECKACSLPTQSAPLHSDLYARAEY